MACFEADLGAGDVLDLWLRPRRGAAPSGEPARVRIGEVGVEVASGTDFRRHTHRAAAGGPLAVSWDEDAAEVSLAYSYREPDVFSQGIRIHWTTERNRNAGTRFRLHLQPPFGWMNDPNGSFEANGVAHAFYQHAPHARRWQTMHWGHAQSQNLVDWVHLPVFLDPRPEQLADGAQPGGAFSGSAIPQADGSLRAFFTDHEDHRAPRWEIQNTALSADTLRVGAAETVIADPPPLAGFGEDMRDPYVFRGPDGRWKMLLGGVAAAGGVVLLYETDDATAAGGWRFAGTLFTDRSVAGIPVECPCLVPLDGEGEGLWALVYGLIGQMDAATRRRNLSFAAVGRFDGRDFEVLHSQEFDFAGDAYAFQGFTHSEHGPMGLAWAANWADVYPAQDFSSCMTLPRRLEWRNGALHTPPAAAVEVLRQETLAESAEAILAGVALPDGLAEVELEFAEAGAPFVLDFAHPDHRLALRSGTDGLELDFDPPGRRVVPRFLAAGARPRRYRIILDVGLVEIFADDGRWCGTKRLDSDRPVTAVRLAAGSAPPVSATVRRLRPARGLPG